MEADRGREEQRSGDNGAKTQPNRPTNAIAITITMTQHSLPLLLLPLLAKGSRDRTLKLWDTRMDHSAGALVLSKAGGDASAHAQMVTCVDAAPGEPLLLSAGLDGGLAAWDLRRLGWPPVVEPVMTIPVGLCIVCVCVCVCVYVEERAPRGGGHPTAAAAAATRCSSPAAFVVSAATIDAINS